MTRVLARASVVLAVAAPIEYAVLMIVAPWRVAEAIVCAGAWLELALRWR